MEIKLLDKWKTEMLVDMKAENTVTNYVSDVKQFLNFVLNNKEEKIEDENELIKNINNEDVNDYRKSLYLDNKKLSTINRKIASIGDFFNYVKSKNIVKENPADNVKRYSGKLVMSDTKVKDILTDDEIKLMFRKSYVRNKGENLFDFKVASDRFILARMLETGGRINEYLKSKFTDLQEITNGYMLVIPANRVKNTLEKRFPIVGKLLMYYNDYISERKALGIESEYIFVSSNGKALVGRDINMTIKKLLKKADIDKHITNHCFRYMATNIMLQRGVPRDIINKILGWTSENYRMQNRYGAFYDMSTMDKEILRACDFIQEYII